MAEFQPIAPGYLRIIDDDGQLHETTWWSSHVQLYYKPLQHLGHISLWAEGTSHNPTLIFQDVGERETFFRSLCWPIRIDPTPDFEVTEEFNRQQLARLDAQLNGPDETF